jgi:hypothetical protein
MVAVPQNREIYKKLYQQYKPTREKIDKILSRYNEIKDITGFQKAVTANKELRAYIRLGYIDSPYNYGKQPGGGQSAFFRRTDPNLILGDGTTYDFKNIPIPTFGSGSV